MDRLWLTEHGLSSARNAEGLSVRTWATPLVAVVEVQGRASGSWVAVYVGEVSYLLPKVVVDGAARVAVDDDCIEDDRSYPCLVAVVVVLAYPVVEGLRTDPLHRQLPGIRANLGPSEKFQRPGLPTVVWIAFAMKLVSKDVSLKYSL